MEPTSHCSHTLSSIKAHFTKQSHQKDVRKREKETTQKDKNINNSIRMSSDECPESSEDIGFDHLARTTKRVEMEEIVRDLSMPFTVQAETLQDMCGEYRSYNPEFTGKQHTNTGSVPMQKLQRRHSPNKETINDELAIYFVFKQMTKSLMIHPYTKYLLVIVGAEIFIPSYSFISCLLWIVTGIFIAIIFHQSLTQKNPPKISTKEPQKLKNLDSVQFKDSIWPSSHLVGEKSEGWMTEFTGVYDEKTNNIRQNRIVFVRLEDSLLYVSYPDGNGKERISKRRQWSDSDLSGEVTFSRHLIYNIRESDVFLAPDGLAERRSWIKKYPIGIRLPKHSVVSVISPGTEAKPKHGKSMSGLVDLAKESDADTMSDIGHSSKMDAQSIQSAPGLLVTSDSDEFRKDKKDNILGDVGGKVLYFFTRTDREKDDWYRRFTAAGCRKDSSNGQKIIPDEDVDVQDKYMRVMQSIVPCLYNPEDVSKQTQMCKKSDRYLKPKEKYLNEENEKEKNAASDVDPQKAKIVEPENRSTPDGDGSTVQVGVDIQKLFNNVPQEPAFLNALLGRIFFDFLRSTYWADKIQAMIQKKLDVIKTPTFLDSYEVQHLDFGTSFPIIQRVTPPVIDSQGLWIDLDLTYNGCFCLTLDTKLNVINSRKTVSSDDNEEDKEGEKKKKDGDSKAEQSHQVGHMYDADAYDSGESSEEDKEDWEDFEDYGHTQEDKNAHHHQDKDYVSKPSDDSENNNGKTKSAKPKKSKVVKILRMAEKISNFNMFTETKNVCRDVANTSLALSLEIRSMRGTLVINIPPPPTDRIWYGFRYNPDIEIVARPKVGDMTVNLTHITDWIGKKIVHELQRVAVFPNMDDIPIGFMIFKLPSS